jgi:DNA-binding NtrC family response regulator
VVAATHRDLESEAEADRFRRDLFYRLNVHILTVPPLRERLSDVPELAAYFLRKTCARFGIREKTIEPAATDALMEYTWERNNVRELRNIIERMVISSDAPTLGVDQVPAEVRESGPPETGRTAGTFQELKAEAERRIVVSALEKNDWNITRTAKALGLSDHASLLKIMRRHKLKKR